MKKIFFTAIISLFSIALSAQSKDADEVKAVLQKYNTAIEKLDPAGTENLFTADSQIFESGSSEGTYSHYLEHHLGPRVQRFFILQIQRLQDRCTGKWKLRLCDGDLSLCHHPC